MKITYDSEVDALYILFRDTTVNTKELADGIAADYDANGLLACIEIGDFCPAPQKVPQGLKVA